MTIAMRGTLVLLAAVITRDASAQESAVLRKIWSTADIQMGSATVSPSGKWLIYQKELNVAPGNSEVWIRPLPGGEPRRLLGPSNYRAPQVTGDGKRLILISTALNRTPSDQNNYIVSATFDEATGTLTAPLRQVTLDGVQAQPRHIPSVSPDGAWLAYAECCTSGALKIVPLEGGNARTLYTPSSILRRATPGWLAWTPDGRSVLFQVSDGEAFTRLAVSVDGGTPRILGKSEGTPSRPLGDGKTWVSYEGSGPDRMKSFLRFLQADGTQIGKPVELPFGQGAALMNAYVSRKDFLIRVGEGNAPLTIVPTAGGTGREISPVDMYHWMIGWSGDGQTVYATGSGGPDLVGFGLDGKTSRRWAPPNGLRFAGTTADGYAILSTRPSFDRTGVTLSAMNLLDGKVRELGTGRTGLSLRGAGGVYGQDRGRLLLEPLVDTRFQVRSIGMRGDSRVVLDLPARLTGLSGIAVHDSRVAFSETTADSVFVRLAVGPKAPFKTVASFPKDARLELAWSFDGGTLAISDGASSLWFIPVGADGKTPPLPRAARLPFSYFYELFWLPDGSGVTVIAQPNGSPTTHVALVRVADPDRPVLLSRDDSHDKWGHLVSPDGKYVVYESERYVGTTLWAVDLDEALKEATRK